MATIRIQHAVQDINGLSKDRYVNTFHVNTSSSVPDTAGLTLIASAVKDFYAGGGAPTLRSYLAGHARGPGASIKMYEMTPGDVHPPIYDELYTFPTLSSAPSPLPSEVACCLSYSSSIDPTVDIRSRRGRMFIGPLNISASATADTDSPARPTSAFINALVAKAQDLHTAMVALGHSWAVYSPKLHLAGASVFSFGITDVSVDDAFDTQRRRGCIPQNRVTFALT